MASGHQLPRKSRSRERTGRKLWEIKQIPRTDISLFLVGVLSPLLLASTPLNSLLLITALALFCLLQQAQRRTDLHRRTDVPVVLIVFSPLLLLPLLQLIPMPTALLAVLSPSTVDIRQLFATSHGEPTSGSWWPASMAPGDTAVAALMMIACLSAGLASFLSVRTYRDLRRPTQALVLSNLLVVSLVVVQLLSGSEARIPFLGSNSNTSTLSFLPFRSADHLGSFLILTGCVTAGVATQELSRKRLAGLLAMIWTSVTICLATASMGVIIGLAGAILCFLRLRLSSLKQLRRSQRKRARRVTALLTALSFSTAWLLVQQKSLAGISDLTRPPRGSLVQLWSEASSVLMDHPVIGIGPGAFVDVQPRYALTNIEYSYRFVENSYLQGIVNFGLIGGLLILVAGFIFLRQLFTNSLRAEDARDLEHGAIAGLLGLALHNVTSFSLAIPGVAVPAAMVLGAVAAKRQTAARWKLEDHQFKRCLGASCVLVAVLLFPAVQGSYPATQERIAVALQEDPDSKPALESAVAAAAWHPSDPWALLDIGRWIAAEQPRRALAFFSQAQHLAPRSSQPHLETARLLHDSGRPTQSLGEYRRSLELMPQPWNHLARELLLRFPEPGDHCRAAPTTRDLKLAFVRLLVTQAQTTCPMLLLQQLHDDDPTNHEVLLLRARVLLLEGHDSAEAAVGALPSELQTTPEGQLLVGEVFRRNDNHQEAERSFRAGLTSSSSEMRRRAMDLLFRTLAEQGHYDDLLSQARHEHSRKDIDPAMSVILLRWENLIQRQLRTTQQVEDTSPTSEAPPSQESPSSTFPAPLRPEVPPSQESPSSTFPVPHQPEQAD